MKDGALPIKKKKKNRQALPCVHMEDSTEFVKLTGDTKATLALLVENGTCKVNASASLVVLPSMADKTYETISSNAAANKFEALPASARDVYFGDRSKQVGARSGGTKDEFLDDNWYFIELHQSILQESTQKSW
jgi:hypothetical protein